MLLTLAGAGAKAEVVAAKARTAAAEIFMVRFSVLGNMRRAIHANYSDGWGEKRFWLDDDYARRSYRQ
jgi:hypothetical protein